MIVCVRSVVVGLIAVVVTATALAVTVTKQDSTDPKETVYEADEPNCRIVWMLRTSAYVPGFGITEKSQCALAPAAQVSLRNELLDRVAADTKNFEGIRNFAWGQLLRGDANDEYARRFSEAFAGSKQWDRARGQWVKPRSKQGETVAKLINRKQVFSELVESFALRGLTLTVVDVEKIIVQQVAVTTRGVERAEKLPINADVVFSVKIKR